MSTKSPKHCIRFRRNFDQKNPFAQSAVLIVPNSWVMAYTGPWIFQSKHFRRVKKDIYIANATGCFINSSPARAAYMCQWTESALLQIMACRLFRTRPLSEPMLVYCHLDPNEQTSMKFESKYKTFHSWKCFWKCCLLNGNHLVQGKLN